jgi:FtsP/CotA-like multicopper oxidase with cupredoxin domain
MSVLPSLGLLALLQVPAMPAMQREPLPPVNPAAALAVANNNTRAAGVQRGNVREIALDIVESRWAPESDDGAIVPTLAFAERGKAPQLPGPLIRVRAGTRVRLSIRNATDSAIAMRGLRPGTARDTLHVRAGQTLAVEYRLDRPGTYFYWGAFEQTEFEYLDSGLMGALIVDPAEGSPPDRVLVISEWFQPHAKGFNDMLTINGKGWPYTERLEVQQDDSVRLRVINGTGLGHPMHLHGFYYRVTSRGRYDADRPIAPGDQPLVVTDLMTSGTTMSLAFKATTPGNWVFHCHFSGHLDETTTVNFAAPAMTHGAHLTSDTVSAHDWMRRSRAPTAHMMTGLMVGIVVHPRPDYRPVSLDGARDIQLYVSTKDSVLPRRQRAVGFAMQRDSMPAPDSVEVPGPVLELRRNEPVRITIHNRLDRPTGVHWHGLEIDSYPDGVSGWSGLGSRVLPQIPAGDSITVGFRPPRSGTFMYHSHLEERPQILSGMYGVIVVSDAPRDTTRDHIVVIGAGGLPGSPVRGSPFGLVNGSREPEPIVLAPGVANRIRIASINPDWAVRVTMRTDTSIARWRPVAKDGADLPANQAVERPAFITMGTGETADVEVTPKPGERWRLEVLPRGLMEGSEQGDWVVWVPIVTREH